MHGNEDTHIESEIAYGTMGLLLLGLGICTALGYVIMKSAFNAKYVQIAEFACACGVIGAAAYLSHMLLSFDKLYLYADRLVIKSVFGYTKRTILFNDIIAWDEDVKGEKKSDYYTFRIYTASSSYKIFSFFYHNYTSISGILKSTAKRDYYRQRTRHKRRKLLNAVTLFGIGALLVYMAFNTYSHRHDNANANPYSIVLLKDVLAEQPEIHKNRSRRAINIDLKNYSKFHFSLSGDEYRATYAKAFVRDVNIGDTVYVGILRSEYRKKIREDMPLNFWEKHFRYNHITVYDLSTKSNTYLDVVHIKSNTEGVKTIFWVIMFFAGMVVFNGIKQVHDYAHYD